MLLLSGGIYMVLGPRSHKKIDDFTFDINLTFTKGINDRKVRSKSHEAGLRFLAPGLCVFGGTYFSQSS